MAKNVISDAICTVNDFEMVLQRFIEQLTIKGLSEKTIDAYTRNIAQIATYFKTNPLLLKEKQLDAYLYHLKSTRTGQTAFKLAIYALRSLFEHNGKKALKNKLPKISQPSRVPVVLSVSECKKLISTPLKFKERFLIAFMYSSGLRIGEIARLRIADIDTDRLQIRVVQGKGAKDRYVPLSYYIAQTLPKYLQMHNPTTWLFNSSRRGEAFSVRSIQRVVRQAVKDAGIRKEVTAHTFRHTYATHLIEYGVDLVTIKNVLGHKNIQTTMLYLHVAQPKSSGFRNPLDILYNQTQ